MRKILFGTVAAVALSLCLVSCEEEVGCKCTYEGDYTTAQYDPWSGESTPAINIEETYSPEKMKKLKFTSCDDARDAVYDDNKKKLQDNGEAKSTIKCKETY